jgi:hypothetical protein
MALCTAPLKKDYNEPNQAHAYSRIFSYTIVYQKSIQNKVIQHPRIYFLSAASHGKNRPATFCCELHAYAAAAKLEERNGLALMSNE